MVEKIVKIPGPGHPLTIEPNPARIVITVGGKTIARGGSEKLHSGMSGLSA